MVKIKRTIKPAHKEYTSNDFLYNNKESKIVIDREKIEKMYKKYGSSLPFPFVGYSVEEVENKVRTVTIKEIADYVAPLIQTNFSYRYSPYNSNSIKEISLKKLDIENYIGAVIGKQLLSLVQVPKRPNNSTMANSIEFYVNFFEVTDFVKNNYAAIILETIEKISDQRKNRNRANYRGYISYRQKYNIRGNTNTKLISEDITLKENVNFSKIPFNINKDSVSSSDWETIQDINQDYSKYRKLRALYFQNKRESIKDTQIIINMILTAIDLP